MVFCLLTAFALRAEDKKLFNGSDLEGWVGDGSLWKVEDGAICGTTEGLKYNTFLYTKADYANFELRYKAKLRNHNSGVQIRSKVVDEGKFVLSGYQADMANGYWGLLYEEKARGKLDFNKDVSQLAKEGEWIDFVVRADGPKITVTVNGTTTVNYVETDEEKGAKTGKIGLQLHGGPPMKVWFKDIVLKPLPDKSRPPRPVAPCP